MVLSEVGLLDRLTVLAGVEGSRILLHTNRADILRKAVIALGILLACWPCAFALDPSLDVNQYAHTAWKVSEGFTKGVIFSIAQTPDGYLWLGTRSGVARFDGVRAAPRPVERAAARRT